MEISHFQTCALAKRERQCLDTWIEKFDLKGHVCDLPFGRTS
jgi:hypothetical protein